MKQYFSSIQFTATQWKSSEQKAKFANQFIRFVTSGYKQSLFPKWFYQRLSNCFGFIAHYNREGFFDTYFTSNNGIQNFYHSILNFPCYGDSSWTYSDVELELIKYLKENSDKYYSGK